MAACLAAAFLAVPCAVALAAEPVQAVAVVQVVAPGEAVVQAAIAVDVAATCSALDYFASAACYSVGRRFVALHSSHVFPVACNSHSFAVCCSAEAVAQVDGYRAVAGFPVADYSAAGPGRAAGAAPG